MHDGKIHQATFVRGNSALLPAGNPVVWRFSDLADHVHLRLSPQWELLAELGDAWRRYLSCAILRSIRFLPHFEGLPSLN